MAGSRVLLIGHGSPDADAVTECQQFGADLAQKIGSPVDVCFMEIAAPGMEVSFSAAAGAAGEGGKVYVLPLFLAAAKHQKGDVSSAVRETRRELPGVSWIYTSPLGYHAHLADLAGLRVREALRARGISEPSPETAVLLVGRGSKDPAANAELACYAHYLRERAGYAEVTYAFQAAASPSIAEGIRRCRLLGARQVVVVPFILFTGFVYNMIQRTAQEAAIVEGVDVICSRYLAPHPILIDIAAQRLEEAEAGQSSLSCDLCHYRWPAENRPDAPASDRQLLSGERPEFQRRGA